MEKVRARKERLKSSECTIFIAGQVRAVHKRKGVREKKWEGKSAKRSTNLDDSHHSSLTMAREKKVKRDLSQPFIV